MTPTSTAGVLGEFYLPGDAMAAAARVREAGWTHFDMLTPFPIHGMEHAMGQKRSWVPWATLGLALFGIAFAQAFQNYVMVFDWPMNFGGKPHASWPAFVPITFELMVLCAAIGSAVIAIVAGKKDTVPQPPNAVKTGATGDRFVLWISATDPKWQPDAAQSFVQALGAGNVRLVTGEGGSHA